MRSYYCKLQANARPVGLVVRFALCRSEFEPPRGWICWPEEAQFIYVLKKKISLSVPRQSTGLRLELLCRCVQVEQRFGGFLDLREKVFFLSTITEDCHIPVGQVFFTLRIYINEKSYLYNQSISLNVWSGANPRLSIHIKFFIYIHSPNLTKQI